jgi:hypothetical protein
VGCMRFYVVLAMQFDNCPLVTLIPFDNCPLVGVSVPCPYAMAYEIVLVNVGWFSCGPCLLDCCLVGALLLWSGSTWFLN